MKPGCTEAAERLRRSGLRLTRQRAELAGLLFGRGNRHVSAEQLYAEATDAHIRVSLATVYNTLNLFTASGLLREVAIESAKTYFDTNTSNHCHFYFEEEARLMDIESAELDRRLAVASRWSLRRPHRHRRAVDPLRALTQRRDHNAAPSELDVEIILVIMVTGKLGRRWARKLGDHGFGCYEEARHRCGALAEPGDDLGGVDDAHRQQVAILARLGIVAVAVVVRPEDLATTTNPSSPAFMAICRAGQVIASLTILMPAF